MSNIIPTQWLADAVTHLASEGWYYGPSVICSSIVTELNHWLDQPNNAGKFRLAGIGKGSRQQNDTNVRGDRVLWLDDGDDDPIIKELLGFVETIRLTVNRELFAGLREFEGHFALYPAGGFYHRHLDTFRDDDKRLLTFLLYLNPHWTAADAGQLRLFTNVGESIEIEPRAGTIVMFRSRDFEHEVLLSNAERRSFTGWFKV